MQHECIQQDKIDDINVRLIRREERGSALEEKYDNLIKSLDTLSGEMKEVTMLLAEYKASLAESEAQKETSKWWIAAIGAVIGFGISIVGWFL